MSSYSIETEYKIYDDNTGDYITVSDDLDGIGLIRIHTNNKVTFGPIDVTLSRDMTKMLIAVLSRKLNEEN